MKSRAPRRLAESGTSAREAHAAGRSHPGGLPAQLQAALESLSGMAMHDVRVHPDSPEPARFGAMAFTRGTEIHLGPGREELLPHEAWHVVQQKRGRVRPTGSVDGLPVNEDPALEREADRAGARAAGSGLGDVPAAAAQGTAASPPTLQFGKWPKKKKEPATPYFRVKKVSQTGEVEAVEQKRRPPSNSRRGQGDHTVAWALPQAAMEHSVKNKPLDEGGEALADLLDAATDFVKQGATNSRWHKDAEATMDGLRNVTTAQELSVLGNDVAFLLNTMPGTAMKNPKSTKGHGEGGQIGGLTYAQKQLESGNRIAGNPWTNLFGLFDPGANAQIMKDPEAIDDKVQWLMILAWHAAPDVYENLDTGKPLTDAAVAKFGKTVGAEVAKRIRSFLA